MSPQQSQVEQLLAQHGSSVLHLAYTYLHNRQDAEDVLQDTLVRFLMSTPQLEGPEHERAWLLRVAANLCKNRLRAPWRQHCALPEDYPAQLQDRAESLALFQAVCALPVKYRAVIHLYYYEDATTAQIASILGRRESTVRSQLHRARALLRASLQGEEWSYEPL